MYSLLFFFQAEDGIRDVAVTGVQTCALPIFAGGHNAALETVENWDLPTLAGAGALRSTANDLLNFLAANLDSTSTPLGRVLAMTHFARRDVNDGQMRIGLNWHILNAFGHPIVWHNGGTGGYRSFI